MKNMITHMSKTSFMTHKTKNEDFKSSIRDNAENNKNEVHFIYFLKNYIIIGTMDSNSGTRG